MRRYLVPLSGMAPDTSKLRLLSRRDFFLLTHIHKNIEDLPHASSRFIPVRVMVDLRHENIRRSDRVAYTPRGRVVA